MAANSVRCPRDRGESVKVGSPLSQDDNDQSELAAARVSAQGSFDSRRGAPGGSEPEPHPTQAHGGTRQRPCDGPDSEPLDANIRALLAAGPLAQLAERSPFKRDVAGSNPARPTLSGPHRLVAQDVALSRRKHGFDSRWGYGLSGLETGLESGLENPGLETPGKSRTGDRPPDRTCGPDFRTRAPGGNPGPLESAAFRHHGRRPIVPLAACG